MRIDDAPLLDDYYAARGWDTKTGNPSEEALQRLSLGAEAEELRKMKVIER
jgi:aldehyde:ferredoxin oxidoreductase